MTTTGVDKSTSAHNVCKETKALLAMTPEGDSDAFIVTFQFAG